MLTQERPHLDAWACIKLIKCSTSEGFWFASMADMALCQVRLCCFKFRIALRNIITVIKDMAGTYNINAATFLAIKRNLLISYSIASDLPIVSQQPITDGTHSLVVQSGFPVAIVFSCEFYNIYQHVYWPG